jgi:DNA-binding PadR family transcriptional regulator
MQMPRTATTRDASTELENCVLAILARMGPCTSYAVRRFLAVSRSSYWSASAGAIYPLLERLDQAGLATCHEDPFGTRQRRRYALTRRGRRQLQTWLSAPVPMEAVATTHDPIRTRVFFLESVPVAERRAFLDDAIQKTAATLAEHQADLKELQPTLSAWERWGRKGAIGELEARLTWLRKVRRSMDRADDR